MTPLETQHKTRRIRRCDSCLSLIEAGAVYRRLSLPPHVEMNSGDRWWTITVCAPKCEPRPQELSEGV